MQILAVVVRYNTPLAESQTVQGLSEALGADPGLAAAYRILIWDNSPEPLTDPHLPIPFVYRHSERNLGVSGAYNNAMEFAEQHGHPWMLLLDQDTKLTAKFLSAMSKHGCGLLQRGAIAAIAPTVRVGNVVVSPKRQVFNGHRPYPQKEPGILPGEPFAINSGCVIRTAALREIGGFSLEFWLDYSDVYVLHQLFLHRKKVWFATDAELEHEMTVMDYDRLMTPWRYKNFSHAESAFNDLYKSGLENAVQNLRLFARAVKQRKKYRNPEFSRIAWRQLLYRLRVSRSERVARWAAVGNMRRAGVSVHDIPMERHPRA